ncbi:family 43 glycosylhydrolase [Paenibacillus spongiae]|uniref:Family 43 glycosylhydrolase n=1 Tax=Paenibacillus spongiae TaxID=2909671 RepID=A0ABY5S7A9_9BACL|nr:family 43 glycosylhydrolase [Paenibacillus spongiae]UVI28425.1 family 43 glycosylhydrolase [Paenibacillus spongiae]
MKASWYAPAGEYCKDHTIIERDGRYHLFSISGTEGTSWYYSDSESRLSHSVSDNLRDWTFVGHVLSARGEMPAFPELDIEAPWREDKVWAPHCIEADGKYWMFYTGVEHHVITPDSYTSPHGYHVQRICLATSTDLVHWEHRSEPVFVETSAMTSHPGAALRDPMVLRDEAGGRWIMYVTMYTEDFRNAVGALLSDDLLHWSFDRFVYIEPLGSDIITESPFVTEHGGNYYLFVNKGYAVADNPLGPFSACIAYEGEQDGWGAGENFVVGGKLRRSILGGEGRIVEQGEPYGGQIAVFDLEWTGTGFRYAPLSL